jgi:glycosyltransferase involved in cell wall biosynthesis/SAM-dependent methyltransferase
MKIAVISECFLAGGLETRVKGIMLNAIHQGHEIFLITQHYDSGVNQDINFSCVRLVNFNEHGTVVKALKELSPDIADIHPFYSLISASAACHEIGIPYVATVHGPYLNDKYIPSMENARCVFVVSEEVRDHVLSLTKKANVIMLKNGINLERFKPVNVPKANGKVAIISRLDPDKSLGVLHCICYLLGIGKKVDVIGKGKAESAIREKCKGANFLGHIENIGKFFENNSGKYEMIAGMGRVALEGLSMKIPVLLVGYEGIKEFITPENVKFLSLRNFSGRGIPDAVHYIPQIFEKNLCTAKASADLLYKSVLVEHDENKISAEYLSHLPKIRSGGNEMINEFLTTRYFTTNDKRIENVIFPLPRHWWSRFYEYAWAAEFCKETDVVMDAACGIPHPFKFYLAENCKEVHAVDHDADVLSADSMNTQMKSVLGHSMAELKPYNNIIFENASISKLPHSKGMFDTIFCISALEHMSIDKRLEALKEFQRTLKDNGKIILTIDYCINNDYGSMTIDELAAMVNEAGLKFAGDVDKVMPANAITWNEKIYCFRSVLVKDSPIEEKPKDDKPAKKGRKKAAK